MYALLHLKTHDIISELMAVVFWLLVMHLIFHPVSMKYFLVLISAHHVHITSVYVRADTQAVTTPTPPTPRSGSTSLTIGLSCYVKL